MGDNVDMGIRTENDIWEELEGDYLAFSLISISSFLHLVKLLKTRRNLVVSKGCIVKTVSESVNKGDREITGIWG